MNSNGAVKVRRVFCTKYDRRFAGFEIGSGNDDALDVGVDCSPQHGVEIRRERGIGEIRADVDQRFDPR